MAKDKRYIIIAGSQIDTQHPDIIKATSAADLSKVGIFDHLEDAASQACVDLFTALHPEVAAPVEDLENH